MTATDVHDDIDAPAADVEASGDELFQLVASNDHKSVGRLWLGFGLLFLVDLANTGTMARIVSFLSVGVLLVAVGYFAPVPPKSSAPSREAAA